jgi:hypothetical protein
MKIAGGSGARGLGGSGEAVEFRGNGNSKMATCL